MSSNRLSSSASHVIAIPPLPFTSLSPTSDTSFIDTVTARHNSLMQRYPSLHIPPISLFLLSLHTIVRSADTPSPLFSTTLQHLCFLLLSSSLHLLPFSPLRILTPTRSPFPGCILPSSILSISILRAGDAFQSSIRSLLPHTSLSHLLIQRQETSPPTASLLYSHLPSSLSSYPVILLTDPMLATGSSLCKAIEELIARGGKVESLMVCVLIGCEVGIRRVMERWPGIKMCVQWVDEGLNEDCYILPGIGDAGDRYFST